MGEKRRIISMGIVILFFVCICIPSISVEAKWVKKNGHYMYTKNEEGTKFYKNQWVKIDGKYYFFDKKGYQKKGWLKYDGHTFYLNSKGVRVTGFQTIKKKQYYFNRKGVMITGWIKYKNQYYYLNSSGVMVKGVLKIGEHIYYFDNRGRRVANADICLGNMVYHFSKDGTLEYRGTEIEKAVKYINICRMIKGYEPLEFMSDSNLTYAALRRARELEIKQSHIRPDNSKFSTILYEDNLVDCLWCGECILWGREKTGIEAAKKWLTTSNSNVLLEENANAIGVASHKDSSGREYWTAIVIQE